MSQAPLDIGIVGWHSHNQMFDEIGSELRDAGHRIARYAHRDAFTATPDPLAAIDILLCVAVFPLTRAILTAAPRLRAIVSAVTGVDGVDIDAATERAVVVANAQTEENVIGMAEATVMLMLAALYDLEGAQNQIRQNLWRPPHLKASQLRGKTIGLIGLGKIGRETARLLAPWGASVQYSARRDADLAGLPPMQRVDLETLMRSSDVVLVMASLNPDTRGLIGAEQLRLMKPNAVLVNTARGSIVDEAALADTLKRKAIAGAAFDCFAVEPLPEASPLRGLPNAILTPHMIGHTVEAHHSLEVATRENLSLILAGKPPRYLVNPAVLPAWMKTWGVA
ncbi:MAG: NAD(P)-dependent oxidoreductase [Hyphomicrobiales bacterium]